MCNSSLHEFLKALPKCEHHVHLEGVLTPSTVFELAAKNKVTLPDKPMYQTPTALAERYEHFESLDDFLEVLSTNATVLVSEDDFHQLAWSYFVTAHADGVVHAEVSFDPQAHTSRGVDISSVVRGFSSACRRALMELGISTRLIMGFMRDMPIASAEETLRSVHTFIDDGTIHGVGLDSSETGFPPEPFEGVFDKAKQRGLRRTAHAGEEGGVQYLKGALASLQIERVDHGIRLVEDPALMRDVANKKTLLTICPLSNVRLNNVKSVESLPLREFLEAGVQFSINSDDPAYFEGSILSNYCAVQEAFDFHIDEWKQIGLAAINGSWADTSRKERILAQFSEIVSQYTQDNGA